MNGKIINNEQEFLCNSGIIFNNNKYFNLIYGSFYIIIFTIDSDAETLLLGNRSNIFLHSSLNSPPPPLQITLIKSELKSEKTAWEAGSHLL